MENKEKKPIGRPRKYKTADDLYAAGEAYIAQRAIEDKPPTLIGLALALGFTGRQALCDYERRPEFVDAVKRLKSMCEDYYEQRLTAGGNPAGAIFALKNFGWRDKVEVEHDGNINLSLAQSIEAGRQRVAAAQCAPDDDEQS